QPRGFESRAELVRHPVHERRHRPRGYRQIDQQRADSGRAEQDCEAAFEGEEAHCWEKGEGRRETGDGRRRERNNESSFRRKPESSSPNEKAGFRVLRCAQPRNDGKELTPPWGSRTAPSVYTTPAAKVRAPALRG